MTDIIPHGLAVLFGAIALSLPFMLFNAFNGGTNPQATAPFTHYGLTTMGLNLVAVGLYVWLAKYPVTGEILGGLGVALTVWSYASLTLWYRRNPNYTWRLFRSENVQQRRGASQ